MQVLSLGCDGVCENLQPLNADFNLQIHAAMLQNNTDSWEEGGHLPPKMEWRKPILKLPPKKKKKFYSLSAYVHMVMWHNAMTAFSCESDSVSNSELRPTLSDWEVIRSTFMWSGTQARTPKLCYGLI